MRSKTQTERSVEMTKFEVKFPTELQIEPLFTIEVSKNYTTRVFTKTMSIYGQDRAEIIRTDTVYILDTRHNVSGLPSMHLDRYSPRYGSDYHDLLDVRLAIEDLVVKLQPKRTKLVEQDNADY